MNEEQISELDRAFDLERKRQRAEAIAKQFSPAVRDSPLCQAITAAEAGFEDWHALLGGWVTEQWILHRAAQEMQETANAQPTPTTEETSSASAAAE